MLPKNYFFLLLICGLILLQLVVIGNLNLFSGRVNLTLVVLVILINLADFPWVMAFSVITGLLLDLYSGLPFGVLTLTLWLSAAGLKLLFLNFFANFSFHSLLLLGLISVMAYHAIFISIVGALYFLGLSDYLPHADFFQKIVWQAATTEAIMIAAYYLINPLSKRFQPVFLG